MTPAPQPTPPVAPDFEAHLRRVLTQMFVCAAAEMATGRAQPRLDEQLQDAIEEAVKALGFENADAGAVSLVAQEIERRKSA